MAKNSLQILLDERAEQQLKRSLPAPQNLVDFSSNDYLGLAQTALPSLHSTSSGAGGSRLLTGNTQTLITLEENFEKELKAGSATYFPSGYMANLALLSALSQKGTTILYDKLVHASMRDGLRLGLGRSFSFDHNDMADLQKKLATATGEIYILTESVFSMDGDIAPLEKLVEIAQKHQAHLIVDEAHALGVCGQFGMALHKNLADKIFVRIYTFGKAVGYEGAVVCGPKILREYLCNFARPMIYSTAASPHTLVGCWAAWQRFKKAEAQSSILQQNIHFLCQNTPKSLQNRLKGGESAIFYFLVGSASLAKRMAKNLQENGLDIRPILSPTVATGSERLRICLHSFNTKGQMQKLLEILTASADQIEFQSPS